MARNLLSEQQVNAILRRAAELQEARGQKPGEMGLSPDEVVRVGAELGLDPNLIRQAVADVTAGVGEDLPNSRFGLPLRTDVARVIPGEMTDEDWFDLVEEIRRQFGQQGELVDANGAREWNALTEGMMPAHVTVRTRDGNTRVSAQSNIGASSAMVAGMGGFFILLTIAIVGKRSGLPAEAVAGVGLALTSLGFGGWWGYVKSLGMRRRAAVHAVVAKAAQILGQTELKQRLAEPTPLTDENESHVNA